jgi:hypothetical protein
MSRNVAVLAILKAEIVYNQVAFSVSYAWPGAVILSGVWVGMYSFSCHSSLTANPFCNE